MSLVAQELNDTIPVTQATTRAYIPRPIFGYINSSAEREDSMRGNRAAYEALAFLKAHPDAVNFGTSGNGSALRLAAELFN